MSVLLITILVGCQTGIVKTNDGTIKEVDQIEETAEDSNLTTINEDSDNSTDLQSDESTESENTNTDESEEEENINTNPNNLDSDGDGITDDDEMEIGTDPNDADSDDDGIIDGDEEFLGTNPSDADSDDDGINDGDELIIGTDPNDADSDDDGITDGDEINQGTDPTNDDTDGDGVSDFNEIENGTDPTDNGLDEDTGNFWDWGDSANSNCPDCDPAIFSGIYDLEFAFQSSINSTVLCTSNPTAFMSSLGDIAFTTSCTSSTGASFEFGFDLSVSYANPYASAEYAVLYGTVSITIPNGTVISQYFAPNSLSTTGLPGYVTTLAPANFGPYWDITFIWQPLIQTPSGEIEYTIYFQGFRQ